MSKITITFSLLFCLITTSSSAQEYIKTNTGQSILIKNSGDWEFADQVIAASDDLFAHATVDAITLQNPKHKPNSYTVEEESMYNNLMEQLKFYEADYYVKYYLLKSQNANNVDLSNDNKRVEQILKNKYEKSTELLNTLSKFTVSNITKRQEILFNVKSQTYRELKLSTLEPPVIKQSVLQKEIILPSFEIDTRLASNIERNSDCELVFNGFDNRINKKRKEVKSGKWFGYTHPKLISHFKDNDFLSGVAAVMNVDGKTFLNLKLVLSTRDARRSYGFIDSEAMLRITLVNGDRLYLLNQIRSEGMLEAYTGNTIYQCLYLLEKDDIKELAKTEIDRVGLMWTTGFEEYDIYNVDFIMNQLLCLNNEKKD